MNTRLTAIVLAAVLAIGPLSCTPTEQGVGIGAVTGAGAGALISGGHRTRGAAVGAVAGGLIGGLIGHTYEVTKFCPTCGRGYHQSKQFCPTCGTALQQRR